MNKWKKVQPNGLWSIFHAVKQENSILIRLNKYHFPQHQMSEFKMLLFSSHYYQIYTRRWYDREHIEQKREKLYIYWGVLGHFFQMQFPNTVIFSIVFFYVFWKLQLNYRWEYSCQKITLQVVTCTKFWIKLILETNCEIKVAISVTLWDEEQRLNVLSAVFKNLIFLCSF